MLNSEGNDEFFIRQNNPTVDKIPGSMEILKNDLDFPGFLISVQINCKLSIILYSGH